MAEIESRVFTEDFYAATRTALGAMNVEVVESKDSLLGYEIETETQEIGLRDRYSYAFTLRHTTYRGDVVPEAVSEILEVAIESPEGECLKVSLLPCEGTVIVNADIDEGVNEQELSLIPGFIINAANETHNAIEESLKETSRLAYQEYRKQYDENAETGELRSDFQVDIGSYDAEKYQTIDLSIYELAETLYASIYVRLDENTTLVYELDMEDFTLCTWVDEDGDIRDVTNQIKDVVEFNRLARILLS